MGGAARVVLGGLLVAVSTLVAVGYHSADFTVERELVVAPPSRPDELGGSGGTGELTRQQAFVRCTGDGGSHIVDEDGDMVLFNGSTPVPQVGDTCDDARRDRGVRALLIAGIGAVVGGWLIVARPRSSSVPEPAGTSA